MLHLLSSLIQGLAHYGCSANIPGTGTEKGDTSSEEQRHSLAPAPVPMATTREGQPGSEASGLSGRLWEHDRQAERLPWQHMSP